VIVLTVTDLRVRMLPDAINWPGFAAGLLFSAFVPPNDGIAQFLAIDFSGGAAGSGCGNSGWAHWRGVWKFSAAGTGEGIQAARGREGMGMGDVK